MTQCRCSRSGKMADANLTPSDDSSRREDNSAPSLTDEQGQCVPVVASSDRTEGEDSNIAIEPPEVEEEVKSPPPQSSSSSDAAENASLPPYLATIKDFSIQTVCIKGYERRTTATFPRDEFYAFRVVSIVHDVTQPDGKGEGDSPSGTEGRRWEVWRRYSEFELLKTFLTVVYPHNIIPPIPEKKLQGGSGLISKLAYGEDVDFLTRRQRALEIFLVRTNRHSILKQNAWFIKFLSTQENWKIDLVATGFQEKLDSKFKVLAQSLMDRKPDSQFMDILNYSADLKAALESLVITREKMKMFWVGMYRGYGQFSKVLHDMVQTEPTLADHLQLVAGHLDSYSSSIDTFVDEEEIRYLLPMKEYIGFCDSLKAVVRRQEQVQAEYDRAEDEVFTKVATKEKLEKEKEKEMEQGDSQPQQRSFSFKTMFRRGPEVPIADRIAAVDQEMHEVDQVCKGKRKKLKAFNDAALSDFESFNQQKIADFRSVLINLAQLEIQLHRKGLSTWSKIKQSCATAQ